MNKTLLQTKIDSLPDYLSNTIERVVYYTNYINNNPTLSEGDDTLYILEYDLWALERDLNEAGITRADLGL